ncbi:MAG: thioredoxin family protein [Thermomicrobiales bacterium]|nr:thioredoxin family protein [Thermomicrobiales bacterium]
MTYPDPTVRAAVASRFVALRLNIKHPKVRDFSVLWMPTILIADKRGVVHYRSISSLPPEDLLDVLDLGEAQGRMRSGEYARAEELLVSGLERRKRGPLTDELIFWHGIARYYLERQDHSGRDRIWQRLLDEFPDSIWAHRIPRTLLERRA